MALDFDHGRIDWLAADAAGATYVVNTMSFQPKAIKFVVMGLQSSVDATSQTFPAFISIGFAAGTADRRCVGVLDVDAAATMDTNAIHRDDAVLVITTGTVLDGRLDLTALASNGFTLTVDEQIANNISVFWYAWGGSDITNVETLDIVEPGATGDQDYGTFAPTQVMFAGCQANAANTYRDESAGIMFGAGSITDIVRQFVFATNQDFGSASSDTDRYGSAARCLAMMVLAGGNPNAEAALVAVGSQPASAFRVNWSATAAGSRRFIAMAIKGGQWRTESIVSNAGTVSVTALSFQPQGGLLVTHGTTEQTPGSSTTEGALCIGGFSSTSSRRGMGYRSENATASSACEVDLAIDYDQVIVYPDAAGAIDTSLDVSAINSDGIDITRDAGSTNMLVGYVLWASTPQVILPSVTMDMPIPSRSAVPY